MLLSYYNSAMMDSSNDAESNNERLQPTNSPQNNNSPDPMEKQINTFLIKSKGVEKNNTLKEFSIKTDATDPKGASNLDDWKVMFQFLESVQRNIPFIFNISKDETGIEICMSCPSRYVQWFNKIFRQYMSRSGTERTYMFYKWNRNPDIILKFMSNKLEEIEEIEDCPFKLYEEKKQLVTELNQEEGKDENDHTISLLKNKLYACLTKLLMALYKRRLVDDSYIKLDRLHKRTMTLKPSRNRKLATTPTFAVLLQYILYYNNVFVPYEPKNLAETMKKCKENYAKDPWLAALKASNEMDVTSEDDSETESSDKNQTTLPPPETVASALPQVPTNASVVSPPIPANAPATSSLPPPEPPKPFKISIKPSKVGKKNPKKVFKKYRSKLQQYKLNIRLKARRLLIDAHKLNKPQLEKHINVLRKKMENKNLNGKYLKRLEVAMEELQYQT